MAVTKEALPLLADTEKRKSICDLLFTLIQSFAYCINLIFKKLMDQYLAIC
jgi:hypothetical protein